MPVLGGGVAAASRGGEAEDTEVPVSAVLESVSQRLSSSMSGLDELTEEVLAEKGPAVRVRSSAPVEW